MTDQEINKAIHHALGLDVQWLIQKGGWFYKQDCFGYVQLPQNAGLFSREDADKEARNCPEIRVVPTVPKDYVNDLNACAEFEKILDDRLYSDTLKNVICDEPGWLRGVVEARYHSVKASARQRCEAFLRVKGLWRDA